MDPDWNAFVDAWPEDVFEDLEAAVRIRRTAMIRKIADTIDATDEEVNSDLSVFELTKEIRSRTGCSLRVAHMIAQRCK